MRKRGQVDESAEDQKETFEWSNRWQYILFFFAYVMNFSADSALLLETEERLQEKHKNLQFVVLAILFGAPILFLQISIGQYTRNGCLILGEMFPVFYGIGYSMLLVSFCELANQLYYSTKLMYYAILTIWNNSPAWMKCYKSYFSQFPNCISRGDIDWCGSHVRSHEPCFEPNSKVLSAFIFKEAIAFGRIELLEDNTESHSWFVSQKVFVISLCVFNAFFVLVLLLIGTNKTLRTVYTSLRMGMILCLGLLLSIGVVLFIQPGIHWGLRELMEHYAYPHFLEVDSWAWSVVLLVKSLRLAEGGHILFGSFIPRAKPDFWTFLILIGVFILIILCATIYYHLFLGLLLHKLNMDITDILEESEENVVFVLFPTFLGILPSSYFFSLVFFFVLFLLNYFSMVVKIIVIEQTITTFFQLSDYFVYVRYTLCFMTSIVALSMEKNEVSLEFLDLQNFFGICSVVIVAVQMIMVIVYGMQNFFDDIEYIMKVRLKVLMRLMWILTPFACMGSAIEMVYIIDFCHYMTLKSIFVSLILIPVVIAFFVKFFQLARRKNLIGMLRPTDMYGPPDVEDRILRVLYNTRLTVKYRRNVEVCFHECLLNSNAVKTAIEEELRQMQHFASELIFKAEDKTWEEAVSLQFGKHQKYLLKALKKYQTGNDAEKTIETII